MKMVLIEDWRTVLAKAWSVRFGMLGAMFYVVGFLIDMGAVIPFLDGVLSKRTLFILSLLSATAGFVSRFIQQDMGTTNAAPTEQPKP